MSKKNKEATKPHDTSLAADRDEPIEMIKQNSNYTPHNQAAPSNEIFFEEKSNPLSSKGN